jgi:hypothetical protein
MASESQRMSRDEALAMRGARAIGTIPPDTATPWTDDPEIPLEPTD